jgi:hypothetical protein
MVLRVRDSKESWQRLLTAYLKPKRRRRGPGHGLAEPVEPPNSPKPLSGGAAAALEFDD